MRRVVCGYGAKSYGNFFVALIEKLAASPVHSIDSALVSNLAAQTGQTTLWPNDIELQDRFVTAPLYQWLTRGRLRMLLTAIEGQLRTQMAETQKVAAGTRRRGAQVEERGRPLAGGGLGADLEHVFGVRLEVDEGEAGDGSFEAEAPLFNPDFPDAKHVGHAGFPAGIEDPAVLERQRDVLCAVVPFHLGAPSLLSGPLVLRRRRCP